MVNKMRKISERIWKKIIKRYVAGDTVRKIAHDLSVGVATAHKYKEEAKRKIPDLEELRELSIQLRKTNITFLDAARAAELIDELNELGVSLSDLGQFIKLGEKAFSAGPRGSEEIAQSSIRLIDLEEKSEKPYEEVLEDFEKKTAQSAKLKAGNKRLKAKKKHLEEENSQFEDSIRKRKKELKTVKSEIDKAVSTKNQLKGIGIPKLAKTAKFIPEFESLGFDAEEVQKLADWRKKLQELGVDPNELEDFIRRKGPLHAQISELETKNQAWLRYIDALEKKAGHLIDENSAFSTVHQIHSNGIFYVSCKFCNLPNLPIRLPTKEEYHPLKTIISGCKRCGNLNIFCAEGLAARIGLTMFPTS